jgi:hypothetical protein
MTPGFGSGPDVARRAGDRGESAMATWKGEVCPRNPGPAAGAQATAQGRRVFRTFRPLTRIIRPLKTPPCAFNAAG